jgi:hypothetical protein
MTKDLIIRNSTAEFLIFQSQNKEDSIEVKFADENVWLSQKMIAKLFNVHIATVNEHLKNIFESNELNQDSVIRKFLITASDNKKYNTKFYSLDVIISVGYFYRSN